MRSARISLALALGATIAAGPARAADPKIGEPPPPYGLDWQVLKYDADQFTIRVPSEWLEIPGFNMARFVDGAATHGFLTDQTYSQNYKHGFQEGPVKEWFTPPYCLVDVHARGRISRKQLFDVPTIDRVLPGGGPFREDGSRGVFSLTAAGTFAYEPDANIVWLNLTRPAKSGEPMRTVAALILTQQGGIQLNFYCREADARRYLDLFERIARSVEIHEYLRYRKPLLEAWPFFDSMEWSDPTMRYIEIAVGVAFVFGLVALCWFLMKRSEADEANPLNPLEDE